ncbi:MAG TPA: lysophospholipid acyltransferase family protein [Phnomibacter sp.]|nr:lysophospholipid acyltransferase family protein [Phnomibacter sp.]
MLEVKAAEQPPIKINPVKRVLGTFWALWTCFWFIATMLVMLVPMVLTYLVPEPGGLKLFKPISKAWLGWFLYIVGCPVTVRGKQYYDPSKNYVVVSNHRSLMDVPLFSPFFPGPNKTIAKKSMSRIPIFGWIYKRASVLVDRGDNNSRRKSFEDMKKVLLNEKLNMAIYPEGTRNKTADPLKTFYDGAFKLAIDCKKDIIPVVIFNTAKVLPASVPFFAWPHPLELHLLPPVSSEGKTTKALKDEIFQIMWDYQLANPNGSRGEVKAKR